MQPWIVLLIERLNGKKKEMIKNWPRINHAAIKLPTQSLTLSLMARKSVFTAEKILQK